MIKVLHFFKTYYPDSMGGIEQVIYQLSEGGIRHGVESTVLYLSPRGAADDERFGSHKTYRVKRDLNVASTGFSFSAGRKFLELAAQVDVIHYHFPWPFMDMVHFMAGVDKPTLVTYHSDVVKQKKLLMLYSPLMNSFLADVDVIVATSPNYVESSPVLKRFRDKVSVIPFGLDRSSFSPFDSQRQARWLDRLGPKFFLFVGALRYYKGLEYLIQAAALGDWQIVIAGGGPQEHALREQASTLQLKNVHFLGAIDDDDKSALLTLCTALVFPSHLRSEAFGLSLLEGAMYGKPLISCEIGTGTSFINVSGETGFVVPPADPVALAKVMAMLWDDPATCKRMGDGALARAEKHFSVDDMLESYADIYRRLALKSKCDVSE